MAYTRRKAVTSNFVYGLDIIDSCIGGFPNVNINPHPQDRHKSSVEFDFVPNQTNHFGVTSPRVTKISHLNITDARWPVLIKFYVLHHWGRGKAA